MGLAAGVGLVAVVIDAVDSVIVTAAGGDAALGLTALTGPLTPGTGWAQRVGRWQEFAEAVRAQQVPLGGVAAYVAADLLLFIPLYGALFAWAVGWLRRRGATTAVVTSCRVSLGVGVVADVLETAGIALAAAAWLDTPECVHGAGGLLLGLSQLKWLGLVSGLLFLAAGTIQVRGSRAGQT